MIILLIDVVKSNPSWQSKVSCVQFLLAKRIFLHKKTPEMLPFESPSNDLYFISSINIFNQRDRLVTGGDSDPTSNKCSIRRLCCVWSVLRSTHSEVRVTGMWVPLHYVRLESWESWSLRELSLLSRLLYLLSILGLHPLYGVMRDTIIVLRFVEWQYSNKLLNQVEFVWSSLVSFFVS